MRLTLNIWRQADPADKGRMHTYEVDDISPDMSFHEMLDVLNERLNSEGEEPVAFDSDCREGICGMERTEDGLKKAIDLIRTLRDDCWRTV